MTESTLQRIRRAGPLLVLTAIILLGTYSGLSADSDQGAPLPFDPLDEDEQQTAVDAALADPEVQDLLDRYATIGAALNTDKHRLKADPSSRMADVWIYDYTSDQTVLVLVDVNAQEVASWALVPYQPPITGGEAARAESLALAHEDVLDALDDRAGGEVRTIARLWSEPAPHPCAEHRCVLVGFFLGETYQSDLGALVDLSADAALGLHLPEEHAHPEVHA